MRIKSAQKVHLNVRDHTCCDKCKFSTKVCSECGKAFKDRRDLLTHEKKVHLNVRDHTCCDKCKKNCEVHLLASLVLFY